MNRITPIAALLLILCLASASAQKRKYAKKKAAVKVEVSVENPRFTEMLSSTQQIVIIDSVVVNKDQLLSAFLTNQEEGTVTTFDQFFSAQTQPSAFVYVNELGNKCYFAKADANGHFNLFTSDLLGREWSTPEPLKGLDSEGLTDFNYPYMMPDGQTLYFAARNGDALGGYDIYRTRLDNENGRFLNPENIGLPFNSEADDFLYIINEQHSLGFFATTRRQSEGKVCVYTFIPSDSRKIYDTDEFEENIIRSYANIDCIKDTWGNGKARQAALNRKNRLIAISTSETSSNGAFSFVINDHTTYHWLQDFRKASSADKMRELMAMRSQLAKLNTYLPNARKNYENTNSTDRDNLRREIIIAENGRLQLILQIKQTEKEIRNIELTN